MRKLDRRFHAKNFGPTLDKEIRDILEELGTHKGKRHLLVNSAKSEDGAFLAYSAVDAYTTQDADLKVFLANKLRIELYFVDRLADAYKKVISRDASEDTSYYNAQIDLSLAEFRASVKIALARGEASSTVFTIDDTARADKAYQVTLPFPTFNSRTVTDTVASVILDTFHPIKSVKKNAATSEMVFVVSKNLLDGIANSFQASIKTQIQAQEVVGYADKVAGSMARLGGKEELTTKHGYEGIFTGRSGVAWNGSIFSAVKSAFAPPPKHNLDRVIRLLENYLNPFKQLGHTHGDDVKLLIDNLKSLRGLYESEEGQEAGVSATLDSLVAAKLKELHTSCEDKNEAGSLIRRLVFAMDKILPGIQRSVEAGTSRAVGKPAAGGAGATDASGALRLGGAFH